MMHIEPLTCLWMMRISVGLSRAGPAWLAADTVQHHPGCSAGIQLGDTAIIQLPMPHRPLCLCLHLLRMLLPILWRPT